MKSKEQIIEAIKRTTAENDGVPLGMVRFQKETGISREAWLGKFWPRWSEAVAEAGFTPNARTPPFERDSLVEILATLTRANGHFPTDAEIGIARANGTQLPHHHLFRKLGSVAVRIELVRAFARARPEFRDVLDALPTAAQDAGANDGAERELGGDGHVYLFKLGKHYKIGKTFSVPRRHQEIAIELPEKPDVVHVITTDDPSGIEAYWHKRFAAKNTNGEWFALTHDDVRAFKRRRFM